ncbi:MAG: hypothetical protein EA391_00850 [Balneolaceae bacterium]|nr:MAG: hypothetical protein EA391_00850 [Balneolaceae bacterium]
MFSKLAADLRNKEKASNEDFIDAQRQPQEIGGYYHPDILMFTNAMRPNKIFNSFIDSMGY